MTICAPTPMAMPQRSIQRKRTPEVRPQMPGAPGAAGQPGRPEEADPQTDQGRDDVPFGRHAGRGDRRHLGRVLAGHVAGHGAEDAADELAHQEADEGVEEPAPGRPTCRGGDTRPVEKRHVSPVGPVRATGTAATGGGMGTASDLVRAG